jgi:predicted nucleic acid-binding protein
VSVYLDASVLVSLFAIDSLSARADSALRARTAVLIVSDFAAAEFASAIARRVRMKFLMRDEARAAFSTFDAWLARTASLAAVTSEDVLMAAAFLRRLDLTLRTQDAVHIAMAQRLDADLLTFDKQMAAGAKVLGTKLFRG